MASDSGAARSDRPGRKAPAFRTFEPPLPDRIGRFRVERVLGEGGLGVVYAGRDPELERSVALKLVRGEALVRHADSRARLVREARTLARLDHPNVVRVFDVGWVDENDPSSPVFIAMELVVGCTLREWLRAAPRTWREIRARFLSAGRGLAGVHASGFVHRDFKPSNVLVSDDDRVLLADFGLVKSVSAAPEGPWAVADTTSSSGSDDSLDDPLTRIGTVIGTPHYMAPEQRAGRRVIAASDQYSFCVALGEALFGGSAPGATDAARVPKRLRRAVQRGRAERAGDRFPTMDPLLAALEAALQPHAGSTLRWAAAGAVVSIGASMLALSLSGSTPCDDPGARRDALWGPERRAEIEATLAPTLPAGAGTWLRLSHELDTKTTAWAEALRDTCDMQGGSAFVERDAARHACLANVHAELEGIVLALERPHAQTWVGALQALRSVDDAESCVTGPGATLPDPPMRELAHLNALIDLGHHHDALAAARRLELEHAEDARVVATAAVVLGRIALADAALADAADHFARAYWLASEVDEPWARRLAAEAAILMLRASWLRGGFDEARTWQRHADVAVARAQDEELEDELTLETAALESHLGENESAEGRVQALLDRIAGRPGSEAHWRRALGMHLELLATRGDYELALQEAELSLAVARDTFGDEHPVTALAHYHVAMAHDYAGRKEQTLAALRSSLRIQQAAFGPGHVQVARTKAMIGNTLQGMGRGREARDHLEHALAVTERIHGPHHRETGEIVGLLATNAVERGDLAAAEPLSSRELEILGRWLPEHTDQIVIAKGARSELLLLLDRTSEAEALAKEAIVGARAIAGPYSSLEIEVLNVLLRVWLQDGRAKEALAESTRALEAIHARGETATRDAALMSWFQGKAHLQRGAAKEAAAALLAAIAAIDRGGIDQAPLTASIQLDLARALAQTGQPKSARKAAELALAGYRSIDDADGVAATEAVLAGLQ